MIIDHFQQCHPARHVTRTSGPRTSGPTALHVLDIIMSVSDSEDYELLEVDETRVAQVLGRYSEESRQRIRRQLEKQGIFQVLSEVPGPEARPQDLRSTRSFRRRNFASTHPYLADQVLWLGLASVDRLNEIYTQNQDMEAMLRVLNRLYLERKDRYPREDRYRARNLYGFLGRGRDQGRDQGPGPEEDPNQDLGPRPEQDLYQQDPSQQDLGPEDLGPEDLGPEDLGPEDLGPEDLGPYADSDGLIDTDQLFGAQPSPQPDLYSQDMEPHSPEPDPQSQDLVPKSSDLDLSPPQMVRVGGRFLNERRALRGVLPESAKRLDIWKKPRKKPTKSVQEFRPGMAIRKKVPKRVWDLGQVLDLHQDLEEDPGQDLEEDPGQDLEEDPGQDLEEDLEEDPDPDPDLDPDLEPTPYHHIVPPDLDHEELSSMFDRRYADYLSSGSEDLDLEVVDLGPIVVDEEQEQEQDADADQFSFQAPDLDPRRDPGPDQDLMEPIFYPPRPKSRPRSRPTSIPRSRTKRHHGGPKIQSKKRRTATARSTTPRPMAQPMARPIFRGRIHHRPISRPKVRSKKVLPQPPPTAPQSRLDRFFYRRGPAAATTVLEAESDQLFIGSGPEITPAIGTSGPNSTATLAPLLGVAPAAFERLHLEYTPVSVPPASAAVFGETFTLMAVNPAGARAMAHRLVLKLARHLAGDESLDQDLALRATTALIHWHFHAQDAPSDQEWHYLRRGLDWFRRKHYRDAVVYWHLAVLYTVFRAVGRRHGGPTLHDEMGRQWCHFWGLWFQAGSIVGADGASTHVSTHASTHAAYAAAVLSHEPDVLWSSLASAVEGMRPAHGLLTAPEGAAVLTKLVAVTRSVVVLLAVALALAVQFWTPFLALIHAVDPGPTSTFLRPFVDAMVRLPFRSWPERLVLAVYHVFARRRFYNFDDEPDPTAPAPAPSSTDYGSTSTQNTTTFHRLLYIIDQHAMGAGAGRRFAAKVVPSSRFSYEPGPKARGAYANRANIMAVLRHRVDVDLGASVADLTEVAATAPAVHDLDLYVVAWTHVREYCGVAGPRVPVDAVAALVAAAYTADIGAMPRSVAAVRAGLRAAFGPGSWPVFVPMVARVGLDGPGAVVDMVLEVLLRSFEPGLLPQVDSVLEEECWRAAGRVSAYVSRQMGRLPVDSRAKDSRLARSIEVGLQCWVHITAAGAKSGTNATATGTSATTTPWNRLLLQDFPYVGNQYLRDRFGVFLVAEILQHHDLRVHATMVVEMAVRAVASWGHDSYGGMIVAALARAQSQSPFRAPFQTPIQTTATVYGVDFIRPAAVNTTDSTGDATASAVLTAVASSTLPPAAKTHLCHTFFTTIHRQFSRQYRDVAFVAAVRRVVDRAQSQCASTVADVDSFHGVARAVGMVSVTADRLQFRTRGLRQQVTFLHHAVVAAAVRGSNIPAELDRYIDLDLDPVYHLAGVYLKAAVAAVGGMASASAPAAAAASAEWTMLSHVLQYVVAKLAVHRVDVGTASFGRFAVLVGEVARAAAGRSRGRAWRRVDTACRRAVISAAGILVRALVVFLGYRDRAVVAEAARAFVLDHALPAGYRMRLNKAFSPYSLGEVCSNYHDMEVLLDRGMELEEGDGEGEGQAVRAVQEAVDRGTEGEVLGPPH